MKKSQLSEESRSKAELAIKDFELLVAPDVIGRYLECELIHIFLTSKSTKNFYHYYAIINFEDYIEPDQAERYKCLTEKLYKVTADLSLGIVKKRLSLEDAKTCLLNLSKGNIIFQQTVFEIPKGIQLLPKVHIPALWGYAGVPTSRVLKPNLWGDRYIIECSVLRNPFQDTLTSADISKINEKITSVIPIDLGYLPDKIGSIIFQFPITILSASVSISKDWTKAILSIIGDIAETERENIFSTITTKLDSNVTGSASYYGIAHGEELTIGDSNNLELRVQNKLNHIIYHSSMVNFIRGFNMSMSIGSQNSEPRTFTDSEGTQVSIPLFSRGPSSNTEVPRYDTRTRQRIYQNEIYEKSGRFLSVKKGQREKAMDFVHQLLKEFSSNSTEVWLWDPYLQFDDIISILYYVQIQDVKFKCITSFKKNKDKIDDPVDIPRKKLIRLLWKSFFKKTDKVDRFEEFRKIQKNGFLGNSNNLGVQLEFRASHDNVGFGFHDRFLFFIPESIEQLPTVFSLGASVNSLGKSHHLMQQTLDPRNIVATFEELWETLNRDDSVIIQIPRDLS